MKKTNIKKLLRSLVILPFIMGCSSNGDFPYSVGERLNKIDGKYMNEKVEFETFTFFEYEQRNYILRSDIHKVVIIDIHSYPKKQVTKNDFYKLKFGMNIYEVVEIVGLPFKCGEQIFHFRTSDNSFTGELWFSYDPDMAKDLIML